MAKRGDARSLATALDVEGVSDERHWLAAHPCECGGHWERVMQSLVRTRRMKKTTRMTDEIEVRCGGCGKGVKFYFVVVYDPPL